MGVGMNRSRRKMLQALSVASLGSATSAKAGRGADDDAWLSPPVKPRLRVALMQMFCDPDVESNYTRAFRLAREAAREKPDLMVFPEYFALGNRPIPITPYAQDLRGPVCQEFAALAREFRCHLIFGIPEKGKAGIYNTLVLTGPQGTVGLYHKTHLHFSRHDPGDNEQEVFQPGDCLGDFTTPIGRLGLFTCHDGVYPEVPRCLALNGADLLVWCLNNGSPMQWAPQHVYYNIIPLAAVNIVRRNQTTGALEGGGSALLAADGKIICQSVELKEEFLVGEVDLTLSRKLRAEGDGMHAFFRVRRPDLYGPITRRKPRGHGMAA